MAVGNDASAGRGFSSRMPHGEQLRLLAKVARMYHERGVRQPQIAAELRLSQPRVSRLLKQAAELGIVQTVVVLPPKVHTDLEEELQGRYGLRDAVVVDTEGTGGDVLPAIGAATAVYLDTTLTGGEIIGISSWSETLLSAMDVMRPKAMRVAEQIVQLFGGVGNPTVQVQATRLTGRLAEVTGARPVFMPAPGLVGTPAIRRALVRDPVVTDVMALWGKVTTALVGIGSLEPSALLRESGNAIAEEEQSELRDLGAVGDVCLRFFDADGRHVRSRLDQRVLGISPHDLRAIDRRVGLAGGRRKYTAIRAALLGAWVTVLVTDIDVARRLVEEPG
jgi:DNA-binding transcriptional regulator LsrR (DeoR family)